MGKRVLATIAIPVHNGARYLRSALESALMQRDGLPDVEILVVDNCSADATGPVSKAFAECGIEYVRYDDFVTMGENWNRCLHRSRGEYILLLHADDILERGALKRAVELLESFPNVGFCFGTARMIDDKGFPIGEARAFERDRVFDAKSIFTLHVRDNFVYCPTVVVRRSAYRSAGMFRSDLRHLLDWDMWLRLEAMGWGVAYVSACQASYRVHPDSATNRYSKGRGPYEALEVIRNLAKDPNLPSWARPYVDEQLARRTARVTACKARTLWSQEGPAAKSVLSALQLSAQHIGLRAYKVYISELLQTVAVHIRRRLRPRV